MAVRPKCFQKRSVKSGQTQMELSKRDAARRRAEAEKIAGILDRAAHDWVEVVDDGRGIIGKVLRAVKSSGMWFDWTENDDSIRIVRIDALAKLLLNDARTRMIEVRCPERTGNENLDYVAYSKWVAKVKAIKDAARLDNTRFYWNTSDWKQDGVFRITAMKRAA